MAALVATPAAVPVAGGTDLMAGVNAGLLRPAALVSLGRLGELRGWEYQDGHALLGACLTHARMSRPDFAALIPALAAAARSAGPPQVRNAGTLGGNIITAAPSGDTLPVLAALEATLLVAGPEGQGRQIPVSSLLAGMDRLHPAELLAHVRVPLLHAPQTFLKATARSGPGGPWRRWRWSSTRYGARCAARSAASRRCRCVRWTPSGGWRRWSTGTANTAGRWRRRR